MLHGYLLQTARRTRWEDTAARKLREQLLFQDECAIRLGACGDIYRLVYKKGEDRLAMTHIKEKGVPFPELRLALKI